MWRHPLKWAIIPGLLLAAMSVFMTLTGPKPHGNLPDGFKSPILAFEFLQTHKQVINFFKVPDPQVYVSSIRQLHQWDMGFLVVYTLFLALVAWGSKQQGNVLAMAAWLFCPLMAGADVMENFTLNSIAMNYSVHDTQGLLQWLNVFTWLKWGSIASLLLCFVPWLWQKQGVPGAITAGIAAATFALALVAYSSRSSISEFFAIGVSLSFLGLFVVCLTFRHSMK